MATAKQIAWRKKFAALSKAGKLPKKRRVAKKGTRNGPGPLLTNPKKAPVRKRVKKAVTAPSQVTRRAPTKRLKARRSANTKRGYFPNPARKRAVAGATVWDMGAGKRPIAKILAHFKSRSAAVEYAKALANKTGRSYGVK